MRANTNGRVEPLIRDTEQIHEFLPCSSQLTSIGHPGHPPFLISMKVKRSKELGHKLGIKVQLKRDHILNGKLLHEIQGLSKVGTVLLLPHVIHINPVHVHIGVLLALDHIQINEILLLGLEQIIPSEVGTRIHIRVDPPSRDKLSQWYLIHAHGGLLLLGGGGLGPVLGGIGALWSFILVAQTLGTRVTAGIGTASRCTRATT